MYNEEKIVTNDFIKRKTIIALTCLFLFFAGVIFFWKILYQQPKIDGALTPLRKGLEINEMIFSNLFSNTHLTTTYSKDLAAPKVRVNGDAGLAQKIDTSTWRLQIVKNEGDTLTISLAELQSLPKTEIVFDFKCIEGWNQVTHWGGIRFSDFIKKYNLFAKTTMPYVGMQTPDSMYYVGIDMASMMHPQTLLCYEMNGKPLPLNQGFPLRLIIPVKYGVKHLKRLGTIFFSFSKPRDYWYERGYDYYCGL
jgi:DMSO/TMAO reductase YedYZ molybdopterin-dependent catalytic subunit